ncbi:MAG: hypothetical protein A2234_04155 [Elusimicrobia bacterium RIFOXYA2_FULL_58_8]|nr:MAG: hypothetical protein A2285_00590 [Elusimicrobia bacterium RIFOXYA12_FULL_57_11]OGS15089.1 MAG: hypothetical protein A2234_04155 [Elusimicrobia bacterium RIFOXYA2_FULL_58_8]
MAARKKFRVKVRVKVRNRLLRSGSTAAGIILCLALAVWLSGESLKASRRFIASRLTAFRPAAIVVDSPAPEAAASALELLSGQAGSPLTGARCRELAAKLKSRHPALASARITRNFFTRKAAVHVTVEPVVTPLLLNGTTAYLGETGRFMRENLSGPQAPVFTTEVRGPAGPAPALVKFLREVNSFSGQFPARPVKLECELKDPACTFTLADSTRVLWGGFEFTRIKVLRLTEVLKDASAKNDGPLRVDLRSFNEGKIFVSAFR